MVIIIEQSILISYLNNTDQQYSSGQYFIKHGGKECEIILNHQQQQHKTTTFHCHIKYTEPGECLIDSKRPLSLSLLIPLLD